MELFAGCKLFYPGQAIHNLLSGRNMTKGEGGSYEWSFFIGQLDWALLVEWLAFDLMA